MPVPFPVRLIRILPVFVLLVAAYAEQPLLTGEIPPRLLLQKAGYAFAGTVTAVAFVSPHSKSGIPVLSITFHIDQGIRGVHTGQTLTIHEWAGLAESGERYRVGERVVLFLHPQSKLGLTSPVWGALGRLQIDDAGQVILNYSRPDPNSPFSPQEVRAAQQLRLSLREFARRLRTAPEQE